MNDIIDRLNQISTMLSVTAEDINESGRGDHAGAITVANAQLLKQIQLISWTIENGGAA